MAKVIRVNNGDWVTGVENLQNIRYVGIREDFQTFLIARGINTNIQSLKEALDQYGTVVDYISSSP